MANDLEQKARELLEFERHKPTENTGIVCYSAALRAIVAALQAQQPINGDVESSKAAAVPSVDGGPGNYVAQASPPSQQPGAQAVQPYGWHCIWNGSNALDESVTWDQFHHAEWEPLPKRWDQKPSKIVPLYTHPQPPSIPEPMPEDVRKELLLAWDLAGDVCGSALLAAEPEAMNEDHCAAIRKKAQRVFIALINTYHDLVGRRPEDDESELTTYTARLRERIGGGV